VLFVYYSEPALISNWYFILFFIRLVVINSGEQIWEIESPVIQMLTAKEENEHT